MSDNLTSKPTGAGDGNVFFPNILDQYDNPTYNFKLSMLSAEDMYNKNYDSKDKIVIASSGVTQDLGIDDVDINSVPGLTERTGSGTSTIISFTLTEPLGASLLDNLYDYSQLLGIDNYQKAFYILELSFKGQSVAGGYAGDLANNKWVWPILITQMDVSVTGSGSTYDVTSAIASDMAYMDQFGALDKDTTIEASTVGEYFSKLSEVLTNRESEEKANDTSKPDMWAFEFDDGIETASIMPSQLNTSSSKNSTYSPNSASGKTSVHFTKGTAITRVIENILMNTEMFQKLAKASPTADGQAKEKNRNPAEFSTLFRTYTDVKLVKYDGKRNDYAKEIRYLVKKYDILSLTHEQTDVKTRSENNVTKIIANNRIRKRYDHIFTGLNDQVLDFELNFDFAFYQSVPKNAGSKTDSNSLGQNHATLAAQSETEIQTSRKTTSSDVKADVNGGGGTSKATKDGPQVTFVSSDVQNDSNIGVESSAGIGKNILSSLFNQAKGPDMISLKLDIKGDPFWLEPAPYDGSLYALPTLSAKIKGEEKYNETSVFTKKGDVYVLFNSGLPEIVDTELGGMRSVTQYNAMSGIYRVIMIDSTFEGGMFQQKLDLVRETSIDVTKTDIRKMR